MTGIWYFVIYAIIILILWAIEKTRAILKTNFPELILSISSYIYLLSDIKSSSDDLLIGNYKWKEANLLLIVIGTLLLFFGFFLAYKKNSEFLKFESLKTQLEKEINNKQKIKDEYYSLCSIYIKEIFSDFFNPQEGNSRVSLYKHQGTHFTLLGRYSDNPAYTKKGLQKYLDTEGFISLGWQNGTYKIFNVPPWKHSGVEYKRFMKAHCTIDENRLNKLTMHSRSFYIYRFDSSNVTNPHGIIVFEKMSETEIETQTIDKIFVEHKAQLITLLKSMNTLDKIV